MADVESMLVGDCLTDESRLDDVTVTGADFENPQLGKLFDRMLERRHQRLGVSQSLLCEDFPDMVDVIWGATDHGELGLVGAHDRAVQERAVRRRVRVAAARINEWAGSESVDKLMDAARAELDRAFAGRVTRVASMKDDVREVLAEHRSRAHALPSPWRALDDVIRGFTPGRLYVIGARPSIGKSALAQQIAYELAAHGAVVLATMEMEKGEVYERVIAQQAQIYYGGLTSGNPSEFMKSREASWLASGLRDIRVADAGSQTVQGIRSVARSVMRETSLAGVIVDYIHLLSDTGAENETTRIAQMTRGLKLIAMDLKVPVIALSQLNRAVASRGDGKPRLDDLRGSGAIEQDADTAIFLYKDLDAEGEALTDDLHVWVSKNRGGIANVGFDLAWQGDFVRAVER